MSQLDLIHARSLAGTSTHTRADNLAMIAALRAVEAVVSPADPDDFVYEIGYRDALKAVQTAIQEALA